MKTILAILFLAAATSVHAQTNRFAATVFAAKTSDQSITNTTNATTVTELTFNTQANARYVVTMLPIVEASATSTVMQVVASNATAFGTWNGSATSFAATNPVTNEIGLGITVQRAVLQNFYVVAGTNAGNISLTFRSNVASNTNTIKAGSYIRADRVPQ
jgi:hypothetical protein